jgi:hypothetical protein
MQKDIYAIYESYVTEGSYDKGSVKLPYAGPGSNMNANDTSRQPANLGGGVPATNYREENEVKSKEHKALIRDVERLLVLARQGKYGDVKVYCNNISKLAQAAFDTKK